MSYEPTAGEQLNLTPVLAGEEIVVEVEGGFKREPAPSDGLQIDIGAKCVFVSKKRLVAALGELKTKKANGVEP